MADESRGGSVARDKGNSNSHIAHNCTLKGRERSDSIELPELLLSDVPKNKGPPSRASWCGQSAMTAETEPEEELSSSFSSLVSAQSEAAAPPVLPPPPPTLHPVPALPARHHYPKLTSAAFFSRGAFAPENDKESRAASASAMSSSSSSSASSVASLPDEEGHDKARGAASSPRRRGGRRPRSTRARGSTRSGARTAAGPYQLEEAELLEVPSAELLPLGAGVGGRGQESFYPRGVVIPPADITCQRREDDDVLTGGAEERPSATTRKHDEDSHGSRKEASLTSPSQGSGPASGSLVCRCCYDDIDPQSTMPTFTCRVSLSNRDHDFDEGAFGLDSDDDEANALPPKPTGSNGSSSNNNNNNNTPPHAVCGHCLASYVHEWVFGGTNYPLRRQPSLGGPSSAYALELPCLSPDCPTGSYSRSDVQRAVLPPALVQYDEKMERFSRGTAASSTTAATRAAPPTVPSHDLRESSILPSAGAATADPPASPERSRAQLEREETLTERKIRRCAVCFAAFVKESNTCNKIKCPHCNFRFCFVCLTDLPAKGYHHFCTHQYDASCNDCVKAGVTCHLWSHEVDSSVGHDDDTDIAAPAEKDRGIEAAPTEVRRHGPTKTDRAARHVAEATQGKPHGDKPRHEAERFLKKLLRPARKASTARRTTPTSLIIDS